MAEHCYPDVKLMLSVTCKPKVIMRSVIMLSVVAHPKDMNFVVLHFMENIKDTCESKNYEKFILMNTHPECSTGERVSIHNTLFSS